MSRSSFDYARQDRTNSAPLIKRKRKFAVSPIKQLPSRRIPKERAQENKEESQHITLYRLVHALIGLGMTITIWYVVTHTYPDEVKDLLLTNGYLVVLMPFFFMMYGYAYAITVRFYLSAVLALFCTTILFLKLQAVIMTLSLILPLFSIFVIISLFYMRKSEA